MTTLNSNSSSSPMSEFTALKEKIKGLKCQQADLEREIESLQAVEAQMMGPHGPGAKLVDREGFPIQGVDIHGVLDVRHKIAYLMTDHKTISKELEVTILKLHAVAKAELTEKGTLGDKPAVSQTVSATPTSITREAPSRPQTKEPISSSSLDIRAAGATSEPESSQDVSSTQAQEGKTSQATSELGAIQSDQAAAPVVVVKSPVFTVRMVLPDSPAAAAGLMERDEIVAFGDITCSSVQTALREANASRSGDEPTTFAKIAMQMVSNLVRSHVNRPIALQVLRPEENLANAPAFVTPQHNDDGTLTLSLTPQTWSGRGLLGCEVVPIAPQ